MSEKANAPILWDTGAASNTGTSEWESVWRPGLIAVLVLYGSLSLLLDGWRF